MAQDLGAFFWVWVFSWVALEQKFERLLGPKGGVFWMALWELHIYLFIKEDHLFVLSLKLRLVLGGSGYLQVKFQGLGYVFEVSASEDKNLKILDLNPIIEIVSFGNWNQNWPTYILSQFSPKLNPTLMSVNTYLCRLSIFVWGNEIEPILNLY